MSVEKKKFMNGVNDRQTQRRTSKGIVPEIKVYKCAYICMGGTVITFDFYLSKQILYTSEFTLVIDYSNVLEDIIALDRMVVCIQSFSSLVYIYISNHLIPHSMHPSSSW